MRDASRAQGWDTSTNGELLNVVEEAGFDVLLTTDKNLRFLPNLHFHRPLIRPGEPADHLP